MTDLAQRVLDAIEETERIATAATGEGHLLPLGGSWGPCGAVIDILDLVSHTCSTQPMALIVRHKETGEEDRVVSFSRINPRERDQWETVELVRSTPEEVRDDVGTGLPVEPRDVKDGRRRWG